MNANLKFNTMNCKVTFINKKVICEKLYDVKSIEGKSSKANGLDIYSTYLCYRLLTNFRKLRRAVRKEIKLNI